MKELFDALLKLRCTEIHFTVENYSVTFIHEDCFYTLSHPNIEGLCDAINNLIKE